MKRIDLINRLIQEGISEKTLVNFTDKQINNLAERILGEAVTSKVNNTIYSPSEVSAAKQKGQGFGVKDGTVTLNNDGGITVATKEGAQDVAENLKGNQKKIDKNHNGKIDAQDFKILKGQKKKDTNEMLRFYDDDGKSIKDKKGKQSSVSTKDKDYEEKTKSKNIDAKDKKAVTKKVVKTCDDCGKPIVKCSCDHSHLDEKLIGKQKNIDKNKNGKIDAQDFKILKGQNNESKPSVGLSKEKKSAVVKKAKSGVAVKRKVQKESTETKNWVKNLVENEYFHNFTSKNEIMELIKIKLNESETLTHEFGPKVKKGHNGIPEFMTYDAIVKSAEPATAPSKPKTSPGTKPGTKPGTNPNPKPKHPYGPDPGENPEPKASMGEEENAHFQ